jgi:V/A-type H+-transporting ATPase subunit I
MFSVVPMLQLTVRVLEHDIRGVLENLGRLGAVQMRRTRCGPDTAPLPARDHSAEIAHCERLLTRIRELRKLLASTAEGPNHLPIPPKMSLEHAEAALAQLEQRVDSQLACRRQLLDQLRRTTDTCELLSHYPGIEIPLDGLDGYAFLHFVTGSLPEDRLPKLKSEVGDKVTLLPLTVRNHRRFLIAMSTRSSKPELEGALTHAEFHREDLPVLPGSTTATHCETSCSQMASLAAQMRQVDQQSRQLAAEIAPLLTEIERTALVEKSLMEASRDLPRTDQTVILRGWLPANRMSEVERTLRGITNGQCLIETAPAESSFEEQIPVLLQHSRPMRPFEMLVTAYGLPRYHELEPTIVVGLTYLVMFGIMFGDVGHGVVLALAGLLTTRAGRTRKAKDGGLLMVYCGTFSMLFGAAYGSFFGLERFKTLALWHDPLAGDPLALIYGAVVLGVGMISLGVSLNIVNHFRQGDVLGAVLDKFGIAGVVFYWSMLGLIPQATTPGAHEFPYLALIGLAVGTIMAWVVRDVVQEARERKIRPCGAARRGMGTVLAESFVGAFEGILSYFANTVSFVRLAAYAMSHAALLLAAFMMAEELKRSGTTGGLLGVGIIILGNLVAIVLEGIIVAVQALRLEYYEFFGKFFSGAGEAFKPFSCISQETINTDALASL